MTAHEALQDAYLKGYRTALSDIAEKLRQQASRLNESSEQQTAPVAASNDFSSLYFGKYT